MRRWVLSGNDHLFLRCRFLVWIDPFLRLSAEELPEFFYFPLRCFGVNCRRGSFFRVADYASFLPPDVSRPVRRAF